MADIVFMMIILCCPITLDRHNAGLPQTLGQFRTHLQTISKEVFQAPAVMLLPWLLRALPFCPLPRSNSVVSATPRLVAGVSTRLDFCRESKV